MNPRGKQKQDTKCEQDFFCRSKARLSRTVDNHCSSFSDLPCSNSASTHLFFRCCFKHLKPCVSSGCNNHVAKGGMKRRWISKALASLRTLASRWQEQQSRTNTSDLDPRWSFNCACSNNNTFLIATVLFQLDFWRQSETFWGHRLWGNFCRSFSVNLCSFPNTTCGHRGWRLESLQTKVKRDTVPRFWLDGTVCTGFLQPPGRLLLLTTKPWCPENVYVMAVSSMLTHNISPSDASKWLAHWKNTLLLHWSSSKGTSGSTPSWPWRMPQRFLKPFNQEALLSELSHNRLTKWDFTSSGMLWGISVSLWDTKMWMLGATPCSKFDFSARQYTFLSTTYRETRMMRFQDSNFWGSNIKSDTSESVSWQHADVTACWNSPVKLSWRMNRFLRPVPFKNSTGASCPPSTRHMNDTSNSIVRHKDLGLSFVAAFNFLRLSSCNFKECLTKASSCSTKANSCSIPKEPKHALEKRRFAHTAN